MINNELFNYFFERHGLSLSEIEIQEVEDLVKNKPCTELKKDVVKEMFDFYNDNRNQMPKAEVFSKPRQSAIKARIKEYGVDIVREVIFTASKLNFLNGINATSWKANLDWIIKPANFIKILEGNYTNKTNEQSNSNYTNNGSSNNGNGSGKINGRSKEFTINDFM